ncbi:MAG: O-antigen ligase family protein [Oleiphilaceae bacterium]|nr:O-antigen ligase family protein [Oleiphilaceae bacterium]
MNNNPTSYIVPIALILFFFIALLPFVPVLAWGSYNHQRVVQIGLLSCSFLLVCLKHAKINQRYSSAIYFNALASTFIVFGAVSSLLSSDRAFSLLLLYHYILLFGMFIVAQDITSNKSIWSVLLAFNIAFMAITLVSTLNLAFTFIDGNKLSPFLIYDGFISIRFFNQVQAFVLPLLVCCLSFEKYRRVFAGFLFLNCLLMFIGYGRGIVLTYLVFLFLFAFLNTNMRRETKLATCILALAYVAYLGLSYLAAEHSYKENVGHLLRVSNYGRLEGWSDLLLDLQSHHFIYGEGLGMYRNDWGSGNLSHPHNSILQILYEWGAVALCLLLAMKMITLKYVVKYLRQAPSDITVWTIASMWGCGLGYSMFSGVIVMPIPQTLIFLVWGLLVGRVVPRRIRLVRFNQVVFNIRCLLIVALIVGFYFYLSGTVKLSSLIDVETVYGIGPRFWEQGVRFTDFD